MAFEIEGRPEPAAMVPGDLVAEIQPAPKNNTNDAGDASSLKKGVVVEAALGDQGAQRIEIIQRIWGKHGKLVLYTAIGLAMIA
jgi:hypothetical protein